MCGRIKTLVKQLPIQLRKNCKFKVTGVECQFLRIPEYHIIRYTKNVGLKAYAYIL